MHRLFGRDMEYVENMPCTLNMADVFMESVDWLNSKLEPMIVLIFSR